jgi:hypothetical protein
MSRACSINDTGEECIWVLTRKPKEKRPLGTPRCRWVDNIKKDLRDRTGLYGLY